MLKMSFQEDIEKLSIKKKALNLFEMQPWDPSSVSFGYFFGKIDKSGHKRTRLYFK